MRQAFALALASLLSTGPAVAIEQPEPGQTLCWGRIYSKAELLANPQQVPGSMVVHLTQYRKNKGLSFSVKVELADDDLNIWWSSGACKAQDQGLDCWVDCDGGRFALVDGPAGNLVLRTDPQRGISLHAGCGLEEETEEPAFSYIPNDAANASFELVPLPAGFCPDYED